MKVAVAGGGMAGMCAGIAALLKGADVTVFERNESPGKKILMTGNGRCNLANEAIASGGDIDSFYSGDTGLAKRTLEAFELSDMLAFLDGIGIMTVSREGLIYPRSLQAKSVRDALYKELTVRGAVFRTGIKVTGIEPGEEGYLLKLGCPDGSMLEVGYDRVILACGGRSHPETGSDGFGFKLCKKLQIPVKKPLPALTKFCFRDGDLSHAAGVRAFGALELYIDGELCGRQKGEIQFLKNAISGIVAFQLSSPAVRAFDAGKEVTLMADCFTEESENSLFDLCARRRDLLEGRDLLELCSGLMNRELSLALIKRAGLNPEAPAKDVSDRELHGLCRCIKALEINVTGMGGFNESQVTSGGIEGSALDENFMIRKYPGLFAAGEMIDVDGICGGFNLMFAMASGYLAGCRAAG